MCLFISVWISTRWHGGRVFLKHKPRTSNYFFSYQCDQDEVPPLENLENVAVLSFDNYKPTTDLAQYPSDVVCPLNTVSDITGDCERCRRCFNGDAVSSLVRS